MITNLQSGTNVHEIAPGIFRINTPVALAGGAGAFNFNQYLIADESPLLFHTGPKGLFPLAREAMARVIPVETLRYVAFSHFEADECGALNDWLSVAQFAQPVCGRVGAMVSINDVADRAPLALADGESLALGAHTVRWFDTPHLPHGWDSGLMMETSTRTFLCGDLFTQGGKGESALTDSDILGPSEAFRRQMDYYSHSPETRTMLERLAREEPAVLAVMHGSAFRGDGAGLLRELAASLERSAELAAR